HTELAYPLQDPNQPVPGGQPDLLPDHQPLWVPMFVLQRLSNPYIRSNNPVDPKQPGDPNNPYVTVDYLTPDTTAVSIYDHVAFNLDGTRGTAAGSSQQPDLNTTSAWGRRQPYDARVYYHALQAPPPQANGECRQGSGNAGQGKINGHTFGATNAKNGTWPGP